MFKRFVPLAAAIGGFFLAMMLATDAARAEKRVALVVGNSNYQTVPQLPNPSQGCERGREDVPRRRLRHGRYV